MSLLFKGINPSIELLALAIDPLYLSWKLKTLKYNARFIELADDINSAMPEFVVLRIADALNDRRKAVRGSKILLSGMTYKRDIEDVRESPAFDVLELLERRAAEVSYYDPNVPTLQIGERRLQSVNLDSVGSFDAVVIITDHTNVDYRTMVAHSQLVIDCRNATRSLRGEYGEKIVGL